MKKLQDFGIFLRTVKDLSKTSLYQDIEMRIMLELYRPVQCKSLERSFSLGMKMISKDLANIFVKNMPLEMATHL